MVSLRQWIYRLLRVPQGLVDKWGTVRVVGIPSTLWFAWYQLQCRTGWIRSRTRRRTWEDLQTSLRQTIREVHGNQEPPFFFADMEIVARQLPAFPLGKPESERILAGDFRLWEDAYFHFGMPPHWNLNPLSGMEASEKKHWLEVREDAAGDVKGVWELSRFAAAFRLAREYVRTRDEKTSELFWQLFESWLEDNPPEEGVQWRSGQEAALRAMAWIFALRVLIHSPATTPARLLAMGAALAEHARRIEATTAYARSQWNNHWISEGAGLWTIGLLFPELPDADRWRRLGRSILQDASAQFFPDGGYVQHSHNYHRLAIHLMIWVMRLGEVNRIPFPAHIYDRLKASLRLLRPMVDPLTGHMPNFGSNDGALFLPLTECEYEDFRPVLQTLSLWLTGKRTFGPGAWDEESLWLLGMESPPAGETIIAKNSARAYTPDAGLGWIKGEHSQAIIRCANFHSRPGHADQLHADFWYRGSNIALDAGTYLYGGASPWQNALLHAGVHNTVTIDGQDQMIRSGRFRWSSIAQGRGALSDDKAWSGEHDGFRRLGATHRRSIEYAGEDRWIIRDEVTGRGHHLIRLHWLVVDWSWEWIRIDPKKVTDLETPTGLPSGIWEGVRLTQAGRNVRLLIRTGSGAEWSLVRAGELLHGVREANPPVAQAVRGWHSTRYGSKKPALSLACTVDAVLPFAITSIWVCES